jgi:olefin beta-lactone synthetase
LMAILSRNIFYMEKISNSIDFFLNEAKAYPNKVAIIYKNEEISFFKLAQDIHLTAIHFQQKGIKQGHKVLVFVPMSIDLYRVLLALFKIGATVVFLDEWVSKKRMEESCKLAKCDAFIGTWKANIFAQISAELRKIPIKLGVKYESKTVAIFKETFVQASDVALITFTTGSTGVPKAAIRTHEILSHQFIALKEIINPTNNDIDLCALPIVLLINLGAGCTSIIANYNARKPVTLKEAIIIKQIQKYKANRIVGSPFLLKQLALYITVHNIPFPHLKKIFTGGATVFIGDAKILHAAFPNVEIKAVYGSTEAEPISAINIVDLINSNNGLAHAGINTGVPHACAHVKILKLTEHVVYYSADEALNQDCLEVNMIGEIIVSGKHVVQQYLYNQDAVNRTKIFIGNTCWHRTGDSGYFTETGNLYFTGRCSTLLIDNEKIVSTLFYENNIQAITGVSIATVLKLNDKLIAIVEMNGGANKLQITDSIKSLGVETISFIQKMPRDPRHYSKIDYDKLKQMYFS